jgi:CPA2 family monovalent cation:H+ antiporter-2
VTIAAVSGEAARVYIELGAIVLALAVLARVSDRFAFSPVPLYLLAGLVLGEGGVVELNLTEDFIELGAQIGVVLLLLALGLEYTARELRTGLRTGLGTGAIDVVLNATPGAVAGLLLGLDGPEILLLAGITYISSSGIISKLLRDLDRLGNRETPLVLSVLVLEDLAMAAYLPIAAAVVVGDDARSALVTAAVAIVAVGAILALALRHGEWISSALSARSDEATLLGVLGVTLLVAGLAEHLEVSAAVGAFLVGIAISGVVQERATALTMPLRDLFAAIFFLFFGLQIDLSSLTDMLLPAALLAVVTAASKYATGVVGARRQGIGRRGQRRAGSVLVVRGEFSIVIAGIGVLAGVDERLTSLAAAYVLLLAITGPLATRFADRPVRTSRG